MMNQTGETLLKGWGVWGEHPDHPLEDWRYEVANDDTRQGYWDWVAKRVEEEQSDKEKT